MPFHPSMARLLWARRRQEQADAMDDVAQMVAAREATAHGLRRRQENAQELAAQRNCRPDPSSIDVSTIDPPKRGEAA